MIKNAFLIIAAAMICQGFTFQTTETLKKAEEKTVSTGTVNWTFLSRLKAGSLKRVELKTGSLITGKQTGKRLNRLQKKNLKEITFGTRKRIVNIVTGEQDISGDTGPVLNLALIISPMVDR